MIDFKKNESEVLEFWKKNKIYEKLKKRNSKGKKFYFLQGPPYTSGKLHIGHAWNNSLKDAIMRYKRMQGMNVWDRGGYDMHGLPTENKVQQKLGFKHKDEVENYGIDKFVKMCMDFSIEHAGYMNEDFKKLGIWMDHENAYMPVKREYIGGEWALIKAAWEQKRLYKGKKIMHWDAQSETSLAKHELEYENVKDTSIFLKFRKKDTKNEYFLIWTTTPWTIPYNLAIMANPGIDYVVAEVEGEKWIMAKALAGVFIQGLLGKKFNIIEEFKGDKLEGQEYVHPFYEDLKDIYDGLKKKQKNVHTVILSEKYVDTSAGTGLVHCAPGCGPEDQEVGMEYGIDAFNTLNERGEFENLGKFTGMVAKEDDRKFIKELEEKGVLLAKTVIEHEYPMSWRSHKPVVFRPTEQWFLKIEDLVPQLIKYNQKVNWIPKKSGESYARWTENLRDNGITRQRYWGCPAPIWVNVKDKEDCLVIGSVEELEKLTGKKFDDLNLHRPWIDEVVIKKNGKEYRRIPDVIDVWIDSGTAGWNCLYNDPKLIKEWFPADLVLEATEQTKLWFNMLQICSAIYMKKSAYENVFCHGMILDFQGLKMSKSLGNIISPYEVMDKYCADILRYYMCQTTAGENISFSWEDIKTKQGNLMILTNIANYILDLERMKLKKGKPGIEEKWILSKYNQAIKKITGLFEEYKIDETIGEIEALYLSLSRDYIKFVRDKANEDSAVLDVLKEVYTGILKMFSTICPFVTEAMWQNLRKEKIVDEESVHLASWPKYSQKKVDPDLEVKFVSLLKLIENGLAERSRLNIGLRWPLGRATISGAQLGKDIEEALARQLNVKKIDYSKEKSDVLKVELDTNMTPDLEAEGYAREISRKIQAERKNAGLKKGELIEIKICTSEKLGKMLKKWLSFVEERVNAVKFGILNEKEFEEKQKKAKSSFVFTIKEEKISSIFL